MDNTKNDGGPAFPQGFSEALEGDCGMSLRDWFAGMALGGVIGDDAEGMTNAEIAEDCYAIADAMLEARK